MARTIAAVFGSRANAEGALQALVSAGLAGFQSALVACNAPHRSELAPGRTAAPAEAGGFHAALTNLRLPEPDAAEFDEAVRHGGCLLSAHVQLDQLDRAISIIEAFDPIDLDRRAADRTKRQPQPGGVDLGAPLGAGLAAGAGPGESNTAALPGMGGMAQSTHDIGSADLRTEETTRHNMGSSTAATGEMRAEERAGAPGTLELTYRRDATRPGRVRAYWR
jgi:hypothetical protein